VIFELLNEPNKNLNQSSSTRFTKRTIPVVRASNPSRVIMVDSYFWANTNYLRALELPDDPNIVAHFHMYQPIIFTHQGAPWMGPEYGTTGVVFPGPPSKPVQPVPDAMNVSWVRDWLKSYNTLPAAQNPVDRRRSKTNSIAPARTHRPRATACTWVNSAPSTTRIWPLARTISKPCAKSPSGATSPGAFGMTVAAFKCSSPTKQLDP